MTINVMVITAYYTLPSTQDYSQYVDDRIPALHFSSSYKSSL